jgi:hypothetical protein
MPLPPFNDLGDLPAGIYKITLDDLLERFGEGTPQRQLVTQRLLRIYKLAKNTGRLLRFVVFGSYVTAKPAPNDVDIILVMHDDYSPEGDSKEIELLFDHQRAQKELGASVFAIRPSFIFLESVDDFIAHWQITRNKTKRGKIEVIGDKENDSK